MCDHKHKLTEEEMNSIAFKVAERLAGRGVKWAVRIALSIFGLTLVWALKDFYIYVRDHLGLVWG